MAGQVGHPAPPAQAAVAARQLPRLLVSRRWWWATLLVLAGMAVMARLGVWQLDRLEQRRAANAELVRQLAAEPVFLTPDSLPAALTELPDREATASGTFDYERQVLLSQQSWQGRPGSHLITPLVFDDSDAAVLVDRGWIPAAEARDGDLSAYDGSAEQTVAGFIRLTETLSGERGSAPTGPQESWFRVDIEAIQQQLPYRLLPVYLLQGPDEGQAQELPYRAEPERDLSEGPHLGYALQWFAFTLLLGAGYLYYVHRHSQPAEMAVAPPPE